MIDLSKPAAKVFLSVRLSAHAEVLSKDGACIPLILVTMDLTDFQHESSGHQGNFPASRVI